MFSSASLVLPERNSEIFFNGVLYWYNDIKAELN